MRRRLLTLRTRVALATAGPILAAVIIFGGAGLVLVRVELHRTLDSSLRRRALDAAQLAVTAPALLSLPGALESVAAGREIDVEVIDRQGRLLDRSLALGARILPVDALAKRALGGGAAGFENVISGGRSYRVYVAPIAEAGGPAAGGAVLAASDTSDIDQTIRRLSAVLTASVLGASAVALLLALALTRRGLRPLRRLADAAGEIERTADSSRRLPEPPGRDEIGELTGVLNRMLDSLAAAREGERRFLADASHELRTPVTSLRGNAEYAARHGASPEVLADLRADAERLAKLVDDLLVLERAGAAEQAVRATVDVGALARAVAAEHDGRVTVTAPEQPVTVAGEPDALRRAIANLVENALVHGPPSGAVSVSVRGGPVASVTVADEGPGPDPAIAASLFERFRRGPDAAGRPGSGLGLSIVAAIARRHGGRVTVAGSAFTIELPVKQRGFGTVPVPEPREETQ